MSGAFFRASGIDSNDGVDVVYVWCKNKGPDDFMLLGSAHVVRSGGALPPGIKPGQFSVTFLLPPGCSPASIFMTDDRNGDDILTDVTITPCSTLNTFRPGVIAPSAASARRDAPFAASRPIAQGRVATADEGGRVS
jgi:hypothetical protein